MVLLLMFPKPCIVNAQNQAAKKRRTAAATQQQAESDLIEPLNNDSDMQEMKQSKKEEAHDEHDESFGELMIHQLIETIEFVLGMISNTASYLRLWALSLAHSELATVFWEKAMLSTLNMDSFIYCFFGFGVFAAVTFGVLLMMDVLECFLHALRLHWVEFQQKFY